MPGALGWIAAAVAVVFLLGWYLSFSAARLDRLHTRVESSRAALDTQLVRRAVAALDAAQLLDPSSALLVADAVAEAMDPPEGISREEAENQLSRALQVAFAEPLPAEPGPTGQLAGEKLSADVLAGLIGAEERVQLARRFHNDAVAQAQRVRRKRVVRWARLAGRAAMPQMFEIDDSLPPGLSTGS